MAAIKINHVMVYVSSRLHYISNTPARFVTQPVVFLWEWVMVSKERGSVRPQAEPGWGWRAS